MTRSLVRRFQKHDISAIKLKLDKYAENPQAFDLRVCFCKKLGYSNKPILLAEMSRF